MTGQILLSGLFLLTDPFTINSTGSHFQNFCNLDQINEIRLITIVAPAVYSGKGHSHLPGKPALGSSLMFKDGLDRV